MELRDLKQTDPIASSSEATAAAASMVSSELRIPLRWAAHSKHITGGLCNEDYALSSIRLLESLEKASAVQLPHSANAEHLFCVLLQHGLDTRTCAGTQPAELSKSGASGIQWQIVEPRLAYLLKISPGTASSVEADVKKLASLFIDTITTVEWASHDCSGNRIGESERKKRPVSCRCADPGPDGTAMLRRSWDLQSDCLVRRLMSTPLLRRTSKSCGPPQ
jgi:hypothetical protein